MNKLELSSKVKKGILIYVIVFIAYHLALFTICGFGGHGAVFWITYLFMLVVFVDIAMVAYFLKDKTIMPKDYLLGYPILRHVVIYVVLEFVISIIFMIGDRYSWPAAAAFATQLIILVIHLIMVISCFIAKEIISDVQKNVKSKTTNIRLLQVEAEMVAETASNAEVKEAFTKLSEQIRYSDPMSSDYLFDIEKEILANVTAARQLINNNNDGLALECCRKAEHLLGERNKKCKALK